MDLGIGQDEEMLAALDELRVQRNPLGETLTRLANALTDKIQADS